MFYTPAAINRDYSPEGVKTWFTLIKTTHDDILNEKIHLTRSTRRAQLTLRLNCELFINIL